MNENCTLVSEWMTENQLCLNGDKTHLMVTGTSIRLKKMDIANTIDIVMDGFKLEESEERFETLLGVQVQPDLKWSKHVEELKSKLKTRLTGLRKTRNFLSYAFRKTVAEGIFNSVLIYCIPLWGGGDKGDTQDLQILQNQAAQHVLLLPPRSNRKMMYDKLDWMSVNQLIFYHSVMTVFKIRLTGEPEYLADKMGYDNYRGCLIVRTTALSFCFCGGDSWPSLP